MSRALWRLAPVAAAAVAHLAGLANGFTNWDDPSYLLKNPLTEDPLAEGVFGLVATPSLHYPIPVTILGYWVQRSFFGLDPLAFHAVSLALHLGIVALVAGLARRLGASQVAAGLAATLFAVHPLVVEPVAWVTGQKDLWLGLGMLAALFVRAHPDGTGRRRVAVALALAVVALFSKPSAVCAPVLFVAVDWALGRRLRDHLALYGALLALAVSIAALALWGHEREQVGPSSYFGLESLLEFAWTIKLQLSHVALPYPLAAKYYPPDGIELALGVVAGLGLLVAWVALGLRAQRRGERSIAAGFLAVAAAYAPTSGLLPISRGAADSYMYLPLALAAAFFAIALARAIAWRKTTTLALALAAAAALALTSSRTHAHWRDAITLWDRVAALNPEEPHALTNAASSHLWYRRPEVALQLLELVESDHPGDEDAARVHAETLLTLGRAAEAEPRFARAAAGGSTRHLDRYGYFLAQHRVAPSAPEVARTAILLVTPELSTRGIKAATLRRAAELAEGFGDRAAASLLRRRLAAIENR
jgi:hypothetical protein